MWIGLSAFVVLVVVAGFVLTSMWFGDRGGSSDDADGHADRG